MFAHQKTAIQYQEVLTTQTSKQISTFNIPFV